MSPCPTCGRSQSGAAGKILFALLGVVAAIFVGIPILIIVCLTAISAIGTSANDEFARVSAELSQAETHAISSQGAESKGMPTNSAETAPEVSQDFIYTSSDFGK